MKKKEIKVEFVDGKKVTAEVRELTYGEYMNILEKHCKIKGTEGEVEFNFIAMLRAMTLEAVRINGKKISIEQLNKLTASSGKELSKAVLELNPLQF